ncbi:Beta-lactamase-related domain-containing protein [Hyphomicrobium sp. 1Nfss2.1]|uniref:serine hydrolase domain-containing protein n=1 Tax=Hyphomicrobium sp. 1Nfss2.1 TaxID=3413936 RepID=UPI003C7AD7E4
MKNKWLYLPALLLVIAPLAASAYAPYLPRLLWEGYPAATWPAPGTFAQIGGADEIAPQRAEPIADPNAKLQASFTETDGRAILAIHNGQIVMEHYAQGITRETKLNSYSLAKSLVGALTLKAISEGRISSRQLPLGLLLSELSGTESGRLPLCRFLDMRSGIAFENGAKKQTVGLELKDLEASKLNLFGPMARLHMQGLRSIEAHLRPQPDDVVAPTCTSGSYSYQNVNTAIVGEVLERAYGKPLQEILSEKIWKPAGAAEAAWRRYGPDLSVTPYCCIYARPIDWLMVAQFLLDNGKPGAPFLPEPMWRQMMGLDVEPSSLHVGHYENFVYHNVLDRPGERLQGGFAYFFGSRGQVVYLMPNERLAVVRFGGRVQLLHTTLYEVERSTSILDQPRRGARK